MPLEVGLTKSIFKIYNVKAENELIDSIVGTTAITIIAKEILKVIPIAGNVANGIVAGVVVFTLGEAIIATSEAIYKGILDANKINEIIDYITDKMKNTEMLETIKNYLEENADKLKDKSPKEIITNILSLKKDN